MDITLRQNGKEKAHAIFVSQTPESSHIEAFEEISIVSQEVVTEWRPRLINIEPVIFLFIVASALQDPTLNALVYEKVCIENFNASICKALHESNHSKQENLVQGQSSYWILYHNYCYEIPAIFLALIYGSFSDNVSRRAAIALPCIGQMLCGFSFIINAHYMESYVGYTLIGQVISGLTGGWIACFMAMFSYLGEATTAETRTFRVMVAEGIAAIGAAGSLFGSGALLDHTNYITVFSIAAGLNFISAVYCFTGLEEPPRVKKPSKNKNVLELFGQKTMEALVCVFRKRQENGRKRLLASLLVVLTGMISFNVIYKVGYLFLRRQPLSWSQTMYGYFASIMQLIPGIGMLLVIPLLKHFLHVRDTSLMIMGILTSSLSEFYLSFCTKTWMVWLVPFMSIMKGGTWVVRSVVSKLVDHSELGAMYAALGALQSISGLIGASVYNSIYPHTIDPDHFYWPGFCFALGTFISVIPLSLTIWLHRDLKNSLTYDQFSNNASVQAREDAPLVKNDEANKNPGYGFTLFI